MIIHRRVKRKYMCNSSTSQTDHNMTGFNQQEAHKTPANPQLVRFVQPSKEMPLVVERVCSDYISKLNLLSEINSIAETLVDSHNFLTNIKEEKCSNNKYSILRTGTATSTRNQQFRDNSCKVRYNPIQKTSILLHYSSTKSKSPEHRNIPNQIYTNTMTTNGFNINKGRSSVHHINLKFKTNREKLQNSDNNEMHHLVVSSSSVYLNKQKQYHKYLRSLSPRKCSNNPAIGSTKVHTFPKQKHFKIVIPSKSEIHL